MSSVANAVRDFLRRSKLPVLLLLYPGFAWLLLALNPHDPKAPRSLDSWISPLTIACYLITTLNFGYLVAVPSLAWYRRSHAPATPAAFRRELRLASMMVALLLPAQGILVALALTTVNPRELWFWGIFTAGGGILGAVMLLQGRDDEEPGVYTTWRALKLDLNEHPRLQSELHALSESLRAPLPQNIMVGLQPVLLARLGTVYYPGGELRGGTMCLPFSLCSVLSLPEFRSLPGEALLDLQAWLSEGREELVSTTKSAHEAIQHLEASMKEWSWLPKIALHPYWIVFRAIFIAAIRLPMYIGKEWLVYYLKEFWDGRQTETIFHTMRSHRLTVEENGSVPAITAQIKEAAISLDQRHDLHEEGVPLHALGEVVMRVIEQHPDLRFATRTESSWQDPFSAWQYIRFRCSLSKVNIEWCRQMALDVTPEPSAATLFEDGAALNSRLIALTEMPLVVGK